MMFNIIQTSGILLFKFLNKYVYVYAVCPCIVCVFMSTDVWRDILAMSSHWKLMNPKKEDEMHKHT